MKEQIRSDRLGTRIYYQGFIGYHYPLLNVNDRSTLPTGWLADMMSYTEITNTR